MFSDFYRGKRVFLTGHTGFKGAWLAMWLKHLGAKVGAYSLDPPSTPSLWELADVEKDIERLGGDICDANTTLSAVKEFKPEVVFHMAAQSLVRPSYDLPVDTFSTNVMGTVHVLDAVRHSSGVKAVVIVTSDKCYENREWLWGYREDDPMGGHDPYSASKGCAELVTASYIKSFFSDSDTAVASVRAGNVIGGGDFAQDRLIPDMVKAYKAGETVRIRSPHAVRPWQHVLEPVCGYMLLAQRLAEEGHVYSGPWNFGPSEESARSVGEVVDLFSCLWGEGASCEVDTANHPHEAQWLKLDCSKARQVLGWQPKTDFQMAMEMTAQWYSKWCEGQDARQLSMDQISFFEGMA